ncbi:MAG: porphobilinogen synthase [Lachnospiraceae bacterium]
MYRGRRLRTNEAIRSLMKETTLSAADLIYPIFVVEGDNIKEEIGSMPGIYHYSIDRLPEVAQEMCAVDVRSCILFGIPAHKDAYGSEAYRADGIVQKAVRILKQTAPELYVIGDVCMCEYTDHGHCGIVDEQGDVKNDETLTYLSRIAVSYAKAGIDMVAPSDMMDGHIAALRQALDQTGYEMLPIMGYSAKYASNYYGPFREAADSAPQFGNRLSYQMDYANGKEALREIEADIAEGVDIIMVKPALAYLDVIKEASLRYDMPIAAYNVSGEYAMLKMAVEQKLMREDVIYETLLSIKRAGADLIITYFALDIAKQLKEGK